MQTRITVNGQEYASADDMPPHVRRQYDDAMKLLADRDGNGVPDVFEGKLPPGKNVNVTTVTSSKVVFNGKQFGSADELPKGVRELMQRSAGGSRGRLHDGGDGFTIHLSGTMLAALVAAIVGTGLIVWLIR